MTTNNSPSLFDFADQLALISSEVLRFRIRNKDTLSDEQKSKLEKSEIDLDKATARVRAQGISMLGALTDAARQEVEAASKAAEATLKRIKKIERALSIATSVLNLALSTIAGNPQGIFAAVNGVRDAVAS